MSRTQLTQRQRTQLEGQLRLARDAVLYRRILAILEVAAGRPVAQVARLLRTSRVSVHQWLRRFQAEQVPDCLRDGRGGNNPTVWTEEWRAALGAALARPPDALGYRAVEWTVALLRQHLARYGGSAPSETAIRRELHALGYAWKRPRYVLEPDPERDKKSAHRAAAAAAWAAGRAAVRG